MSLRNTKTNEVFLVIEEMVILIRYKINTETSLMHFLKTECLLNGCCTERQ